MTTPSTFEEKLRELKRLLNDRRTGLRDSSDTNKTRYAIIDLFESVFSSYQAELREELRKLKMSMKSAIKSNSDAGAGYTIGFNAAIDEFTALLSKENTPQ